MIVKNTVSRDDNIYEAWPCLAKTDTGRLVCVFSECNAHCDRDYTRIVCCVSDDGGYAWSTKRPVTEATSGTPYYNCARVVALRDGRVAVLVDKLHAHEWGCKELQAENLLYFSEDDGESWSAPVATPAHGIVPDKLIELASGRWLVSCHYRDTSIDKLVQRLWYSDDQGKSWSDPVIVGSRDDLNLCEVSIVEVGETLVAFHRENSMQGLDCFKTISHDRGESWSAPIQFPLPGCHRPVAGFLRDGLGFITYRFIPGPKGAQNFMGAFTDRDSAVCDTRADAWTRIVPIDFDRSLRNDLGYSGWVELGERELYVVAYIVDDAPKAQIRGYRLRVDDFMMK